MSNLIKYAFVASIGYALHAAVKQERKNKATYYLGPNPSSPTLRSKLLNTVSDHIGSKTHDYLFGAPVPPRNSGSRYVPFNKREN